jgi:hypothetical protein
MMRPYMRFGALAVALFWSGTVCAQTPTLSCRPMQPGNTYIDPDEKVIGDQVCKVVTSPTPAQRQATTQPAAPATTPPSVSTPPSGAAPVPSASTPSVVVLPDSTSVKLALSANLSSGNATQGQVVEFRVAEDVLINGTVVIKQGTLALGKVTFVQGKRHLGRAGSLDIVADKTHAVDGSKVELHAEAGSKGKGKAGVMAAGMLITATGVGAPLGALWLLKHGKDATIPAGSILVAYTDDDVSVHTNTNKQTAAADAP